MEGSADHSVKMSIFPFPFSLFHSSTTTNELLNDLVAYWPLDEFSGTRSDSHFRGIDLTDNNTVGSATGVNNSGSDFIEPNEEYLSTTNTGSFITTGSVTLAAWVKADNYGTAGSRGIVGRWSGVQRSYGLFVNTSATVRMGVSETGDFADLVWASGSTVMETGSFYHIAAVYDVSVPKMTVYVNGVQDGELTSGVPTSLLPGTAPVWVGVLQSVGASAFHWDGIIDEVGVWTRALSSDEIAVLAENTFYDDFSGTAIQNNLLNGLVSYWELNELSGSRIDSHGSNDLTDNNTVGYTSSGVHGNAADFVKANDEKLTIADASQTGLDITGALSISCWFNLDIAESSATYRGIVGKGLSVFSGGYLLVYDPDPGSYRWYVSPVFPGTATEIESTTDPADHVGNWVHLVATHSPSVFMRIYVNGVREATLVGSVSAIGNNAEAFSINAYNNNLYTDAKIDEVAVWSRALDDYEAAILYNSGSGLHYDFFNP